MIRKHSVTLRGHRTSFSLEDEFWAEVGAIATTRGTTVAALLAEIDEARDIQSNLSSAVRVYILKQLKSPSSDPA